MPEVRPSSKRLYHGADFQLSVPLHVPRFFPSAAAVRAQRNGELPYFTYSTIMLTSSLATMTPNAPYHPSHIYTLLQLLKLDSTGLTQTEFQNLVRKCRLCGIIVTRRARKYHDCIQARRNPPAIIDLTLDDD